MFNNPDKNCSWCWLIRFHDDIFPDGIHKKISYGITRVGVEFVVFRLETIFIYIYIDSWYIL